MSLPDATPLNPLNPWLTTRRPLRLLVATPFLHLGGAMLRFERLGRVLRAWGHDVAWLCRQEPPAVQFETQLPILDFARASESRWDAVMIPGGGMDALTLRWFELLQDRRFGLRLQFVLNEASLTTDFEAVNAHFAPDAVVFNNGQWAPGMYGLVPARSHHVLVGAVDPVAYRPQPYRTHPLQPGRWVIGGQTRKNPDALLAALTLLPPSVEVRLFGVDTHDVAGRYPDLLAAGRLHLLGPISGEAMVRFYDGIDCAVMAETRAGWANFVAEAMASGVPVVCTPHGAWHTARDGETALVMAEPTPEAIAAHVARLMADPALCAHLATQGRETVSRLSWEAYAQGLLAILAQVADQAVAALGEAHPVVDLHRRHQAEVARLNEALREDAAPDRPEEAAWIHRLHAATLCHEPHTAPLHARIAGLEREASCAGEELARLEALVAAQQLDMAAVLASTSWRVMAPVRRLVERLRGVKP